MNENGGDQLDGFRNCTIMTCFVYTNICIWRVNSEDGVKQPKSLHWPPSASDVDCSR